MRKRKELLPNRYYVYLHRNNLTDEIFYVGIGYFRRAYNFNGKSRGKFWHNYVDKHGAPKVEIYKDRLIREDAAALETELIIKYGRRSHDEGGILVNLTLGGEGGMLGLTGEKNPLFGRKLSDDFRAKLSKAHTGKKYSEERKLQMSIVRKGKRNHPDAYKKTAETRRGKCYLTDSGREVLSKMCKARIGDKHPGFGKKRTEEQLKKMREVRLGTKMSEEHRRKSKEWHIENKMFAKKVIDFGEYKVYNTMGDVARRYGVDINTITHWLNGKTKYKRGQFAFL